MEQFLSNKVLFIALSASLVAQSIKLVIETIRYRAFRPHVFFETGGMPSSHSALVSALATGVGMTQGWDSPLFAIASVFAVIVMYDATGIRRAAGQQAQLLNQIVVEVFEQDPPDPLKELLGHTPVQVVVGAVVGVSLMLGLL